MALTQASLKDKIKTEITAVMSITDADQLDKVAGAIAQAVADEIHDNAVLAVTGVTSGGGTAGGTIL